MRYKLMLVMLLGILLIGNVFALDSLGIFKQGQTVNISQVCSDATYITLSSVTYPNSTRAISGINMTSLGSGEFNYIFTNTSTIGKYDVRGISDGCDKTFVTYFEITYSGLELSTGSSIFYSILILLMILLLSGIIYGTGNLPSMNDKDEDGRIISVKWSKYLRAPLYFIAWMFFIAILYISSNLAFAYLGEQLFAKILFSLFRICFGVTPLIVIIWFVWFFVKFFQDKKFQTLLNRGIFPQGKSKKW